MAKRNTFNQDEARNTKIDGKRALRLLKYALPHKKTLLIVLMFMLLSSVLGLLGPMLLKYVIDDFIPNKNIAALWYTSGALVAIHLAGALITRYRTLNINRVGQDMVKNIRRDVFSHLQELPLSYFDSRPHGKIMSRVINYVNALSDLLTNGLVDVVVQLFSLVVVVVFMFTLNSTFTWMCLAGMPVFFIIQTILRRFSKRAWEKYSDKNSNLNAYIHESIAGIRVTQSFAREDKNLGIFYGLCKEARSAMIQANTISLTISNIVEMITVLTTAGIYVVGVLQVKGDMVEVGALVAFVGYIGRFWSPVTYFANFYNSLITATAYAERIVETLEEPKVIEDQPGAIRLPNVEGRVDFENVTFRYEEGERNILENTSFHVEPGQKIALVGPTGAGKSTIINVLTRFYDVQEGKIYIDGHDIKQVTLQSLRKQMGIMLQDSVLFTGTILDNIRYSKPNASLEEVVRAAKTVSAHDFIKDLPEGYRTEVTERGSTFSAGQRQLIAFARAILADPAILILDEATSSIDTETEQMLQQSVEALMKGRTSFVVAHRLSTIKNSDKIMFIADGGIQESGTHEELLEKKGRYYELYMSQYKFLDV